MSIAGSVKAKVPSIRGPGSTSNIRRSEGIESAPAKRSNTRSISSRKDRQTYGVRAGADAAEAGAGVGPGAAAAVVFFTSTAVSAMILSIKKAAASLASPAAPRLDIAQPADGRRVRRRARQAVAGVDVDQGNRPAANYQFA